LLDKVRGSVAYRHSKKCDARAPFAPVVPRGLKKITDTFG